MKFITIFRVHGDPAAVKFPENNAFTGDSILKTNNQDESINKLLDEGAQIISIQTVYDPDQKILFDMIYLQHEDDSGGRNDDDDEPIGFDGGDYNLFQDLINRNRRLGE